MNTGLKMNTEAQKQYLFEYELADADFYIDPKTGETKPEHVSPVGMIGVRDLEGNIEYINLIRQLQVFYNNGSFSNGRVELPLTADWLDSIFNFVAFYR